MLVLHLKRFQFDKSGGGSQKLMKHVLYRMELEVGRGVWREGGREGRGGREGGREGA